MPPKTSDANLTTALEALRGWTQSNLAELRGRDGAGIHAKLRQLNSAVELSHYKFLYRYKDRIAATPFLRTKLVSLGESHEGLLDYSDDDLEFGARRQLSKR